MSIASLIRRPDHLALDERGSKLSKKQIQDLKQMYEEAVEGIDEAVAALNVVSDFLLLAQDSGDEYKLNNASWTVKFLAETIDVMKITMGDCRFHLEDAEAST